MKKLLELLKLKKQNRNVEEIYICEDDNQNSSEEIDEQESLIDNANATNSSDEISEVTVSHPISAFFGYQENISKEDLKTYIHSKASEYLLMDLSHYNIIEAGQGYYWELHEGGGSKGALNSVLHLLNDLNFKEVHVKTTSRTIRITKRRNAPGIDSFNLNENTIIDQTIGVEFKDKMKPVTSRGTGIMLFGAIFAVASILFLLLSITFKYAVIDRSESVDAGNQPSKTPVSQIKKIKEVLSIEGVYIDHITMNKKGEYVIKTLTEQKEAIDDSLPTDNLEIEKIQN